MTFCVACQKEFEPPAGSDVPHRCPHCHVPVLGRYCDLKHVGGGGMGDVYRAREPEMGDRVVAVKIPKAEYSTERTQRRFELEIAASARLQHENVVRVYYRGEQQGRPYLVMEWVNGRKLSDVIWYDHPLSPRRVARIALGIAKGLDHAGEHGVVNRDLKPENVFLAEPNETPKVIDYGLALITDVDEQVTRSGSILGTPAYCAPEQFRDPHSVTIAADVYSLGGVVFSCLTRRTPFPSGDVDDIWRQHREAPRPSVRAERPDVPEAFDRLIQKMMAADRRTRPTPRQVVDELRQLIPVLSDRRPSLPGHTQPSQIDVVCPGCATEYHLSSQSAGRLFRCPNKMCSRQFTVPLVVGDGGAPPGPGAGSTVVHPKVLDAEVVDAEVFDAEVVDAEIADQGVVSSGLDVLPTRSAEPSPPEPEIARLPVEAIVAVPKPPQPPPVAPKQVDTLSSQPPTPPPVQPPVPPPIQTPPIAARPSVDTPAEPPEQAPEPEPKRQPKSPAQRRTERLRWTAAAVLLVAIVGSVVAWQFLPKPVTEEQRWGNVMELVAEKKWNRAARQLDEFATDYPESPRLAMVPFFLDLCEAGDDIYSTTGDAEQGLAAVERIFRDHRDNPAYADYCADLYLALKWLIDHRFVPAAVEFASPAKVEKAREAYELLATVARAMTEDWVAEQTEELAALIERTDREVEVAMALREAGQLLASVETTQPGVDVDETYARVEQLVREHPELAESDELRRIRQSAYAAESGRVSVDSEPLARAEVLQLLAQTETAESDAERDALFDRLLPIFEEFPGLRHDKELVSRLAAVSAEGTKRVEQLVAAAEATVAAPFPPEYDCRRQGSTLVVVWGNGNHTPAPAAGDRVVLALARGVLYAFDQNGTLLWARRLGIDSDRLPKRIEPTATAPAALLAVSSEDNTLVSLEVNSGLVNWRYRVGHDVRAPVTIVPRATPLNAPRRLCGLLPTADGEIHAIELSVGKRLARFTTGQRMTVGGTYDPETRLAYFPAEAKRIFAVDPEAIDGEDLAPCASVLLTDHASGAIQSPPVIVGQYLIVAETSELEYTRLRAFEIRNVKKGEKLGFVDPTDEPLKELTFPGWTWFSPHSTPDRLTLISDEGELGIFGLNLDNVDEAIYPIIGGGRTGVPTYRLPLHDRSRTLSVYAEEHLLWIVAGGRLRKLAIDLFEQEIRELPLAAQGAELAGIPVHQPQVDQPAGLFYLTAMSPGGRVYRCFAVEADSGRGLWQRRLGVNVLGDPLVGKDHEGKDRVIVVDQSGETIGMVPGSGVRDSLLPRKLQLADQQSLPTGADVRGLRRLGQPPEAVYLVAPMEDRRRVALRQVDLRPPDDRGGKFRKGWRVLPPLPGRLAGRPCVCGDFLLAPCADGQVHRVPVDTDVATDGNESTPSWIPVDERDEPGAKQAELYSLGRDAALLVYNGRRLERLQLQTVAGVTGYRKVGKPFLLEESLCGRPLLRDDQLYLFDAAGTLYRLDAAGQFGRAQRTWSLGVKVVGGPELRGDRLVATTFDARLVCVPLESSAEAQPWISEEPFSGQIRGIPGLSGDKLLVADGGRYVHVVRLADGQRLGKVRMYPRVGAAAAPVAYGPDHLMTAMADGTLLVLPMPKVEPESAEPQPENELAEATP